MTLLFATVNWLDTSITLLMVIHVIVCLLLSLVVLMQRPKQEGLGAAFGSGLTDQAFGARTTDVLQKGTVYLGTLFFIITLVLAILIGKRQNSGPSLINSSKKKVEKTASKDAPVVLPKKKKEEAKKAEEPVKMPKTDKVEAKPAKTPEEVKSAQPAKPTKSTTETPKPGADAGANGNR